MLIKLNYKTKLNKIHDNQVFMSEVLERLYAGKYDNDCSLLHPWKFKTPVSQQIKLTKFDYINNQFFIIYKHLYLYINNNVYNKYKI